MKAEETELPPGGEVHLKRFGSRSSDEDVEACLFMSENTKSVHFERWRHTVTMEVYGSYSAQSAEPPAYILAEIKNITA